MKPGRCLFVLLMGLAGGVAAGGTAFAGTADSLRASFAAARDATAASAPGAANASGAPGASGASGSAAASGTPGSPATADVGSGLSGRPVYLQSTETSNHLNGEVHALVDHSFGKVRQELGTAAAWCDILILHLNVKYCRASGASGQEVLDVGIGRKTEQALSEVSWVRFDYRRAVANVDELGFVLQSAQGPMGTKDFRITLEAVPYNDRQTLLHMSYAYSFGTMARLAMQAYLSTVGSDKVGFSQVSAPGGGASRPVAGVRGLLERNTMRYYLAIEAFLGARGQQAGMPPLRKSLQDWFDATERYARQLHELDREAYLDMKLRELKRQETTLPPRG